MSGGEAMKSLIWPSFFAIGLFYGTTGDAVHHAPLGIGGIRKLDARRARRLVAEFTGDELALDRLTSLSVDAARFACGRGSLGHSAMPSLEDRSRVAPLRREIGLFPRAGAHFSPTMRSR